MHVPDGILDAPTSVGTAVVATVGVGLALRERAASSTTAPLPWQVWWRCSSSRRRC